MNILCIWFTGTGNPETNNMLLDMLYWHRDGIACSIGVQGCALNDNDEIQYFRFLFPDIEKNVKLVNKYIQIENGIRINNRLSFDQHKVSVKGYGDNWRNCTYDYILIGGFSRGAVAANLLAQTLAKRGLAVKCYLFLCDPVPGNLFKYPGSLTWDANNLKNYPIAGVFQIIGNYNTLIPGYRRQIIDTHPLTERDVCFVKAEGHNVGEHFDATKAYCKLVIQRLNQYFSILPDETKRIIRDRYSIKGKVKLKRCFIYSPDNELNTYPCNFCPLTARLENPMLTLISSAYSFIKILMSSTSNSCNFFSSSSKYGYFNERLIRVKNSLDNPNVLLSVNQLGNIINEVYTRAQVRRGYFTSHISSSHKMANNLLLSPAYQDLRIIGNIQIVED